MLSLSLVLAALALPIDSTKLPAANALSAGELKALKLDALKDKSLDVLKKREEGTTFKLVGKLERGAQTLVVLQLVTEVEMLRSTRTFVLVRDAKGAWLGGVQLAVTSSTEAGSEDTSGVLGADGALARKTTLRVPMFEEGLPTELVVTSEATGALKPDGTFSLSERYTTGDGAFIDRKSKEELRVFGEKVFYRGNETKPFQALLRAKNEVRFRAGGKPYKLAWAEKNDAIACTNPDGTVQTFTREW